MAKSAQPSKPAPTSPESPKVPGSPINPLVPFAFVSFLVTYLALGRSIGSVEGQLSQLKADIQSTVKSEVSDVKVTLGTVDTKLTSTTRRVDLIAGILPEMKLRVSREEISRPIETAVVTTNPVTKDDGNKVVYVHVIRGQDGKNTIYEMSLDKESDHQIVIRIIGIGRQKESLVSTGTEMVRWSLAANEPQSFPGFINQSGTLLLFDTSAEDINASFLACGISPTKTSKVSHPLGSFKDLIGAIQEKPEDFRTAQ